MIHAMTEFGFIKQIAAHFAALPANGFEGIGDDCAVLPIGEDEALLFTTDLLNEGVHFLRAATSAHELGRKSLAVNLSDIAAMGGRPVATLLSLSLPADTTDDWAIEFMEGYRELSEEFDVALIGGDTTRSESGIVINVTAIGRADIAHIKRRNDARAGDTIFVAGELGASGAGLRDILAGRCDTPLAAIHRNPQPQVAEGIWLGAQPEVHAMMDLSDGLASDIRHILERSHCGAVLDTERIPIAAGADPRQAVCGEKITSCCSRQILQRPTDWRPISDKNSGRRYMRSDASRTAQNSCGRRTAIRSNATGKGTNTTESP